MKKLVFIVTLISMSFVFCQPIGGKMFLSITDEDGKSVEFQNRRNNSSKLRSVSGDFILKDLSIQYNNMRKWHKNYVMKTIHTDGDYHLQLENKKTNKIMDIYIYNVPGSSYFLQIPFMEGKYVMSVLTKNNKENLDGFLESFYTSKIDDRYLNRYEITPKDWNKHRLKNDETIENVNSFNYVVGEKEKEKTNDFLINSTYTMKDSQRKEKLSINEGKAIYAYLYESNNMDFYYTEMYGKIESYKDSAYIFKADSLLTISANVNSSPIEGHEPDTEIIDNGIFYLSNILKHNFTRAKVVTRDSIINTIGDFNLENVVYTQKGDEVSFDIYSAIHYTTKRDLYKREYIELPQKNAIDGTNLIIPIMGLNMYMMTMSYTVSGIVLYFRDNMNTIITSNNISLKRIE